jgi:hypothetical protein
MSRYLTTWENNPAQERRLLVLGRKKRDFPTAFMATRSKREQVCDQGDPDGQHERRRSCSSVPRARHPSGGADRQAGSLKSTWMRYARTASSRSTHRTQRCCHVRPMTTPHWCARQQPSRPRRPDTGLGGPRHQCLPQPVGPGRHYYSRRRTRETPRRRCI